MTSDELNDNRRAVLEVSPDVEYVIMKNDEVLRNGVPVIHPHEDANILKELVFVMQALAEASADGYPLIRDFPVKAELDTEPDGDAKLEDIIWDGFAVSGALKDGVLVATIHHIQHDVHLDMNRGEAEYILGDFDPTEPGDAYTMLCAKAFQAWVEKNNLGGVPDWPVGTTVREKTEWNNWGVVTAHPHRPDTRYLSLIEGGSIALTAVNADTLSAYEPIPTN